MKTKKGCILAVGMTFVLRPVAPIMDRGISQHEWVKFFIFDSKDRINSY